MKPVIASVLIVLSLASPVLAHRSSGRDIDRTNTPGLTKEQGENPPVIEDVPISVGSGSRVKPDRRWALTKGEDSVSCTIYEKQGEQPEAEHSQFSGTDAELMETLANLRSWHPASTWSCE